jgi:hypothetical protein
MFNQLMAAALRATVNKSGLAKTILLARLG